MESDATSANASDVEGDMDLDATTDKVAWAIAFALETSPVLKLFISIPFEVLTQLCCTPFDQVARRCSTCPTFCMLRKDTNGKPAKDSKVTKPQTLLKLKKNQVNSRQAVREKQTRSLGGSAAFFGGCDHGFRVGRYTELNQGGTRIEGGDGFRPFVK